MAREIKTKFSVGETVYVLHEARQQGVMAGGMVDKIMVLVGADGTRVPRVYYSMIQTLVFTPPGGYWSEQELGAKDEAKSLADAYHGRMAAYHDNMR